VNALSGAFLAARSAREPSNKVSVGSNPSQSWNPPPAPASTVTTRAGTRAPSAEAFIFTSIGRTSPS